MFVSRKLLERSRLLCAWIISAARQRGQRVIGISWGSVVHIRLVHQNRWNVWECFLWLCNLCLKSCGSHSFVTCHKSVFISVSTQLHTFLMEIYQRPLMTNLRDIFFFVSLWLPCCFSVSAMAKSSSFSFFFLFPLQVLSVRVQEKEGRARSLGRRDPVRAAQSSWYEVENKSLFS